MYSYVVVLRYDCFRFFFLKHLDVLLERWKRTSGQEEESSSSEKEFKVAQKNRLFHTQAEEFSYLKCR